MLLKAIQEMVIEVLNCKCEQYDSEQLSISLTCVGSILLQMLEREIVSFSEWWCVVVWFWLGFVVGFVFVFFVCFCLFLFFKKTDAFCERWDNTREKHTEERPDHSTKCISSQG